MYRLLPGSPACAASKNPCHLPDIQSYPRYPYPSRRKGSVPLLLYPLKNPTPVSAKHPETTPENDSLPLPAPPAPQASHRNLQSGCRKFYTRCNSRQKKPHTLPFPVRNLKRKPRVTSTGKQNILLIYFSLYPPSIHAFAVDGHIRNLNGNPVKSRCLLGTKLEKHLEIHIHYKSIRRRK